MNINFENTTRDENAGKPIEYAMPLPATAPPVTNAENRITAIHQAGELTPEPADVANPHGLPEWMIATRPPAGALIYRPAGLPDPQGDTLIVCVGVKHREAVDAAAALGVYVVGVADPVEAIDDLKAITATRIVLQTDKPLDVVQANIVERSFAGSSTEVVTVPGDLLEMATSSRKGVTLFEKIGELVKAARPVIRPPVDDGGQDHQRLNDVGFKARIVRQHGERLRYVHEREAFYIFEGGRWAQQANERMFEIATATARSIVGEGVLGDDPKKWQKFADACFQRTKQADALAMVKGAPTVSVSADAFDQNPDLWNVKNGTINLSTGERQPHDPNNMITKIAPIEFHGLDVPCPVWERTLAGSLWSYGELDRTEIIRFIQQLVGYTLSGHTDLKIFVFLAGASGSGKSTIVRMIEKLAGNAFSKLNIAALTKGRGNHDYDLASLQGARMVSASEVEEGSTWDEARLKDLVGGVDLIRARQIFERPIAFKPTGKLWMFGNSRPVTTSGDAAFWSRMALIEFPNAVRADQRVDAVTLERELDAEASGILAWAVRGYLDLRRNGLQTARVVRETTASYAMSATPLVGFLEDCCRVEGDGTRLTPWKEEINGPGMRLIGKADDLWQLYRAWCIDKGRPPYDAQRFTAKLKGRGFANIKRATGMHFLGLTPNGQAGHPDKDDRTRTIRPAPTGYNPDLPARKANTGELRVMEQAEDDMPPAIARRLDWTMPGAFGPAEVAEYAAETSHTYLIRNSLKDYLQGDITVDLPNGDDECGAIYVARADYKQAD